MFRSVFFRRLFFPHLVLVSTAIVALGVFAAIHARNTYLQGEQHTLRDDLKLVARLIRPALEAGDMDLIARQIRDLGQIINCRITVVAADGRVLADNWADPGGLENHRERPEFIEAARQSEAFSTRHSMTVNADMMYLAARLDLPDAPYLRLGVRVSTLSQQLAALYTALGLAVLVAVVGAALTSYQFARYMARPIVELTSVADGIARGNFDLRTATTAPGEMGSLAAALNTMADSNQSLLRKVQDDKAQLLAMLSSMSEGIIATDEQQHIIVANEAAGQLLQFETVSAIGKPLWQVVRTDRVIKAAAEVLSGGQRTLIEAGLVAGRHLEVCLSRYPALGKPQGLVVVIHDATQSVRYQELRKEFVANVSHELRTPLTVIKGYVETLLDGALADPQKSQQYLRTIERHTFHLTNLVNDLLELSRLESQPDLQRGTPVDVGAAVRRTVDLLLPAAQKKNHSLEVQIERSPIILGNPDYLERAIANLVDNAIKYTPDGGRIGVTVSTEGQWLVLQVADNGIGVPAEDIPRIFERFYRVDRSRSREMGGTGLGLSIVKHVAQAHGGSVEVSSVIGKGSTFRLKLPLPTRIGDIPVHAADMP